VKEEDVNVKGGRKVSLFLWERTHKVWKSPLIQPMCS